jgi:hypothetical protein
MIIGLQLNILHEICQQSLLQFLLMMQMNLSALIRELFGVTIGSQSPTFHKV